MSQQKLYNPKNCAFHPKEQIFNFCKNSQCLLPLCPSCVKNHSVEHKSEKTYGEFENINKVVGDLNDFCGKTVKELNNFSQDITDHDGVRQKQQKDIKKKIHEAKSKMLTLVERFFTDFEKEVEKSVISYNDSMKENYGKVQDHINDLKREIDEKSTTLSTDKVLKTLINFHAKGEEQRYAEQIDSIKSRIDYLETQKVEVVCQSTSNQKVIDELGNFIHLEFLNWENEIKYVADFVKTGFMNNTNKSSQFTKIGLQNS